MNNSQQPFLAFDTPDIRKRPSKTPRKMPPLISPPVTVQVDRLSPQFTALAAAFENERVEVSLGAAGEVDPELVVVFDLAGTIEKFQNAVKHIDGFEFLAEFDELPSEPDDNFYMLDSEDERTDKPVTHSLYAVMSNARAIQQLVSLFGQWSENKDMKFQYGLAKFRSLFEQLKAVRPWGPEDRIRDTGLLERWHERIAVAGDYFSPVMVEIELWYRKNASQRIAAELRLGRIVADAKGTIKSQSHIPEISYHAFLVELPIQQVNEVLRNGAGAIKLLDTDEIMVVSPYSAMSIKNYDSETVEDFRSAQSIVPELAPRIALLDGLPVANHDRLAGRITIDDPDNLESSYPVESRRHGTSMASLIIHGDLSTESEPIERLLYVRPILQPHEFDSSFERIPAGVLFTDLLHRSIRRIKIGDSERGPEADSVRIINLSIGSESRALVRSMSPAGRLLDWLAVEYNLLFIVSAGNHLDLPPLVSPKSLQDPDTLRREARQSIYQTARPRGIFSPGDALNVLTVGALHADDGGDIPSSDTTMDLVAPGAPSLYSPCGPGIGRSVKPELHHNGGRALYLPPVPTDHLDEGIAIELARTGQTGPGTLTAAPGQNGETSKLAFSHGTSNAAALVTREANRIFDLLEEGIYSPLELAYPDPSFYPVLTKALLVNATTWSGQERDLKQILDLDSRTARRELTALLGYGTLDKTRIAASTPNRAVLIGAGSIRIDENHIYHIPLPPSLRSIVAHRRFTITLATMLPTFSNLTKYRGAKVFFDSPTKNAIGGSPVEGEHHSIRRGACQHEVIEGKKAISFIDGDHLPISITCMAHAPGHPKDKAIRYGIVVSIETATSTSTTIYDEIRLGLQERASTRVQEQLRVR